MHSCFGSVDLLKLVSFFFVISGELGRFRDAVADPTWGTYSQQ